MSDDKRHVQFLTLAPNFRGGVSFHPSPGPHELRRPGCVCPKIRTHRSSLVADVESMRDKVCNFLDIASQFHACAFFSFYFFHELFRAGSLLTCVDNFQKVYDLMMTIMMMMMTMIRSRDRLSPSMPRG